MNLAQATRLARKILKMIGLTIGLLIIIYLLIKGFTFLKSVFFPTPPPPPEEKFGKLPELNFPKQTGNISYKLNTFTGKLPNFPNQIAVYKFVKNEPNLLDLDNTEKNLSSENFSINQLKLSDQVYQWSNSVYPNMLIQYNIVSRNFDLFSDFRTNKNLLNQKTFSQDEISSQVFDFLYRLGENFADIDNSKTVFSFFNINDSKLTATNDSVQAKIIKVSLFQKQINNKEIYYPYYDSSTMNLFVGNIIVQSHFNHRIVDVNTSSTYGIKTAQQAFDSLKNGNALIFNQDNKTEIEITDVSLAYFIGEGEQNYLIPVIVFKGKNFKAYASALLP